MESTSKQGPHDDQGDARPYFRPESTSNATAVMPVEKYALYYNMNHVKTGTAIIFNHEKFSNNTLQNRKGTDVDVKNLQTVLGQIGFDVKEYKDSTVNEMKYILEKCARTDHSVCDCLMVIVLSHGEDGSIHAKDYPYKIDTLWTPFTADKCKTLAGKPKLFIIQACRGGEVDKGVVLQKTYALDSFSTAYKIPTHADFLFAYSTVPGYFAWRNQQEGSWFINSLCKQLKMYAYQHDFMTILTLATQHVAIDFESFCSKEDEARGLRGSKQVPSVTTMLTRLIKFTEKIPQTPEVKRKLFCWRL